MHAGARARVHPRPQTQAHGHGRAHTKHGTLEVAARLSRWPGRERARSPIDAVAPPRACGGRCSPGLPIPRQAPLDRLVLRPRPPQTRLALARVGVLLRRERQVRHPREVLDLYLSRGQRATPKAVSLRGAASSRPPFPPWGQVVGVEIIVTWSATKKQERRRGDSLGFGDVARLLLTEWVGGGGGCQCERADLS